MKKPLVLAGLGAALIGLGFVAGRAVAADSDPAPLIFSGLLEEQGQPVTGDRAIALSLWPDGTTTASASRLCETKPANRTVVKDGRFEIPLAAECGPAISAGGAAWIEIEVAGEALGRARLGSVPYAQQAVRAQTAAAVHWNDVVSHPDVAALESKVAAYEDRLKALEARVLPGLGTENPGPGLNGRFCGTAAWSNASQTALPGTREACKTACGKPTAHLCGLDEMVRLSSEGIYPVEGWVAVGGIANDARDCDGFGGPSSGNVAGATFASGRVLRRTCTENWPLLCCD